MIPLTNGLAHLQLASVLYDLPRQVVDPHITIKDTIVTKVLKLATVAALTLAALSAQAASEPAVIYDTAGKFDKSFNEAVFRNGVEVYNKDKGVKVKEFEPQNEAQREQGLRRLASRGNGPIVAVGFNMGSAVERSPPSSRTPSSPSSTWWSTSRTSSPSSSRSMKVPSWWVPWQPSPPRPARSASWAAWTSR